MIGIEVDSDGVCVLTLDRKDGIHNLLNSADVSELANLFEQCLANDSIIGFVLTSAKSHFLVGADIDELWALRNAEEAAAYSAAVQAILRRVETCGKPVVAALNGSALGGGFELALACHRRVAVADERATFGLPEVRLGLLPGGGGTQRLPRLIGVEAALPYLLEGFQASPQRALADGLIDELCDPDELVERARLWIRSAPVAQQLWDRPDYRPTINAKSAEGRAFFLHLAGGVRASTWRSDKARKAILACIYESTASGIEVGLAVERRHFAELAISAEARNVIRTTFYHAKNAKNRVGAVDRTRKVAVIGAGMMGAGIATVCAAAGCEVVLVDREQAIAEAGKAAAEKALQRQINAGMIGEAGMAERLSRILPTDDLAEVSGCEIALEAIIEERASKGRIFRAVEEIEPEILIATNTSTLPISGLAKSVAAPSNFIGMHFFSPVDRMQLVEIIPGSETSTQTRERALAFARRIGKTPIVVQDKRGFFTSRVFRTYVHEGLSMLSEGIAPALIEHAGKLTGMPVGSLTMVDEISAVTLLQIQRQNQLDLGQAYSAEPGDHALAILVEQDRPGKAHGRGIFDYPRGGRKRLWPGLGRHFAASKADVDVNCLSQRLIAIQAVEAARCLEEGVISSAADADLGSVLGWSFPASLGGVLACVDGIGARRFVEACDRLARAVSPRFAPPDLLRRMGRNDLRFYQA